MSTPSNLYAEKAFSEHPVALWALDDQADYITYISEANREFFDHTGQWQYTGMTPTSGPTGTSISVDPYTQAIEEAFVFPNSAVTKITPPSVSIGTTGSITLSSKFSFDVDSDDYSIGFYLYSTVGIESIILTASVGQYEDIKTLGPFLKDRQNHIMTTFNLDEAVSNIKVDIEITYEYTATAYTLYLNGLSIGSRSEEFSGTSLGVNVQQLPSTIALPTSFGVLATAYAATDKAGYYLSKNNVLLAKNSTIPMVYGASNSTIINGNSLSSPALILPGMGFLNEIGKKSVMTFEAWVKINEIGATSQRVIGPIASDDGVYVDGNFLVLKVGDNTCSHFIGEWFRPMLLDISISPSSASIMINGERVSSMDLSKSTITLAAPTDQSGKSQDWLGFYTYGDVSSMEIDCVAIYPYEISELLAKKKFVSGQGVPYPQDVNVAYSGESLFIDYSFANYAKNYDYPEVASWLQGTSENLDVTAKRIASPTYALPKLNSNNTSFTLTKLTNDLASRESNLDTITMFPNNEWNARPSYLYFDNLTMLKNPIDGIFGVFMKPNTDSTTNKQILFKIKNKVSGDQISATIEGTTVKYTYKQNSKAEIVLDYTTQSSTITITKGQYFNAGFSISKLVSSNASLAKFFTNRNKLSVYFFGDYSGSDSSKSTTFTGLSKSIGFITSKNLSHIAATPNAKGFFSYSGTQITGTSYELVFNSVAGVYSMDIKTASYWDSHLPLSALSKESTKSNGDKINELDFFQVSLDYQVSKNKDTLAIDTSNDLVNTYITFQSLSSGANKPLTEFITTVDAAETIIPIAGWEETKYRVVDGCVVYPPTISGQSILTDLAVCLHVEVKTKSSLRNKVQTRFLRLSSQSLSDNSHLASEPINAIGTKFGKGMYPYTENATSGFPNNISYKTQNPFKIFRGAGPHLYLTNNSGISILGDYDANTDKGLFFRLNRDGVSNTNISTIQMSMLWNHELFPATKQKIFEIVSATGKFSFYIKSTTTDQKRAEITVELTSGTTTSIPSSVFFYWNGRVVSRPTVTLGEWGMLGIVFKPYIIFDNSVGYFKLTSPMIVNNISTYQLDPSAQAQQIVYRTWYDVENTVEDMHWDDWSDGSTVARTWQEMIYQVASFAPSIDPISIYQVYIGTNKIIADSSNESGVLGFKNYQYALYQNVERDTFVIGTL